MQTGLDLETLDLETAFVTNLFALFSNPPSLMNSNSRKSKPPVSKAFQNSYFYFWLFGLGLEPSKTGCWSIPDTWAVQQHCAHFAQAPRRLGAS